MRLSLFVLMVLLGSLPAAAEMPVDAPRDAAHPARMEPVHIPTHGTHINGVFYLAAGAEAHPTLIFFHGLPGNEQNLDLAQAIRRAGWNVLTLHYRGAWGSPGIYSYKHQIEDGEAALAFARNPKSVETFGIDANRIVLAGHSTGGFVAANTASRAAGSISGLIVISGSDDAQEALDSRGSPDKWKQFLQDYFEDLSGLSGCTAHGLARELLDHGEAWTFRGLAKSLTGMPTLIVTADDGLRPEGEALGHAIEEHGGREVAYEHFETDHPYSDRRLALQETVITWLSANIPRAPR